MIQSLGVACADDPFAPPQTGEPAAHEETADRVHAVATVLRAAQQVIRADCEAFSLWSHGHGPILNDRARTLSIMKSYPQENIRQPRPVLQKLGSLVGMTGCCFVFVCFVTGLVVLIREILLAL
ncbi:MAG: hypothetical protein H6815_04420 [Phycisphaeraceae bacterium]|nr:hypothetical protein [Phycisphaerales bacterium]MCB9859677.1 hypothetical protein [Phycisphaeraceae bacterium]